MRIWLRSLKKNGTPYTIDVIEEFDSSALMNEREIYWIAKLKSEGHDLLNSTDGGESSARGRVASQLERVQCSIRAKKMWEVPEIRAKIIASRTGQIRGPRSQETKQKISDATKRNLKENPHLKQLAIAGLMRGHEVMAEIAKKNGGWPVEWRAFGKRPPRIPIHQKICTVCSIEYLAKLERNNYCSEECRNIGRTLWKRAVRLKSAGR